MGPRPAVSPKLKYARFCDCLSLAAEPRQPPPSPPGPSGPREIKLSVHIRPTDFVRSQSALQLIANNNWMLYTILYTRSTPHHQTGH